MPSEDEHHVGRHVRRVDQRHLARTSVRIEVVDDDRTVQHVREQERVVRRTARHDGHPTRDVIEHDALGDLDALREVEDGTVAEEASLDVVSVDAEQLLQTEGLQRTANRLDRLFAVHGVDEAATIAEDPVVDGCGGEAECHADGGVARIHCLWLLTFRELADGRVLEDHPARDAR